MRKFDMETLVTAYELEQLLYDFANELDINNAQNLEQFYTDDAVFIAGPNTISGLEAIKGFYRQRNENVAKYQKDGARTGRHTFVNVRAVIHDDSNASLHFININYAGEGKAPVQGLQGPSAIADCTMTCRRQPDGSWKFAKFHPVQALLGEDDFMKKMLALSQK